MERESHKYREFIDRALVAFNNGDFDTLFSPADFSPNFSKHSVPDSLRKTPQSREEWHEDLTTGITGQTYKQRQASINTYWEYARTRTAVAWYTERGFLIDGNMYEIEYMTKYEFDENGKLQKVTEYTDSDVQKRAYKVWVRKQQKKEERKPRRFYLITSPRTASNLLVRILGLQDQPNVLPCNMGGYFFYPVLRLGGALGVWGKHIREWTAEERYQMKQRYRECFDELERHVQMAEAENKIVVVKEHSEFMTEPISQTRFLFGPNSLSVNEYPWTVQAPHRYGLDMTHSDLNETIMPDSFLKTWRPTFLIRHPALAFPSRYRTVIDLVAQGGQNLHLGDEGSLRLGMTMHWSRTLYDWYTKQYLSQSESASASDNDDDITWPLVLDADDIMDEPAVVTRFCKILGLDPTKLQFNWTPATKEEVEAIGDDIVKRMFSTLLASGGIMTEKTSVNVDIDVEAKKWREEFGERDAERMEKWVRAAMPDYEFMKARRLRAKTA